MPKATQSGNFKPVKLPQPQTVVARCYSLIDIGTVPNIYNGVQNGVHRRIFLTWELPTLLGVFNEEKGKQPFVVSEEMTLSTNENSNLAKLIAQWRGKAFTAEERKSFDTNKMVGKTCLVQAVHKRKKKFEGQDIAEITNENTNLKMGGILARPNEMPIPEQVNPTFLWDWDIVEAEGFSQEEFDKIPNFLQEKIKGSEEYRRIVGNEAPAANVTEASAQGQVDQDPGPVTDEGW